MDDSQIEVTKYSYCLYTYLVTYKSSTSYLNLSARHYSLNNPGFWLV